MPPSLPCLRSGPNPGPFAQQVPGPSQPAPLQGLRSQPSRGPEERSPSLYDVPGLYDLVVRPGPCEPFYRGLAAEAGGPVLELACGTGRLTLPLAREGRPVTGLDAAPAMLAAAQGKARSAGLAVTFVQGDMRDFDLGRRFALVVLACNSLAHLTTAQELRGCLAAVRRHLAPDGVFAFDIVNPDPALLAWPSAEARRLDQGPNPSSGIAVWEWSAYDPVAQVRTARWHVQEPGSRAPRAVAPLHLRLIFPQELPLLLAAEGLELVVRYGDFARNPLTAAGLNQVCLVRPVASGRAGAARAERRRPPGGGSSETLA